MMGPKLLVAGLLAAVIGLAGFALSLAAVETDLNVLGLALNNNAAALSTIAAENSTAPGLTLTSGATGTITSTVTLTGSQKIAVDIAQYFSGTVTATQVISLHNAGWGYGEIFKLYQLAQASGADPETIMGMRASGMGWGEIARALDQEPGNKGVNLGAAVSGRGITWTITTTVSGDANPRGGPGRSPPGQSKDDKGASNASGQENKGSPPKGKGK
jgi:hypothetical protein